MTWEAWLFLVVAIVELLLLVGYVRTFNACLKIVEDQNVEMRRHSEMWAELFKDHLAGMRKVVEERKRPDAS